MPVRTLFDQLRLQADIAWAAGEWATKIALSPIVERLAPKGDNRPVLTLPGFGGPELSLAPLNRFLRARGFAAQGWGQGVNRGPRSAAYLANLTDILARKLEAEVGASGRKVALVGQSLGGIYARELARARPDLVDRVITLGSPAYLHPDRTHHMNRSIAAVLKAATGRSAKAHLEEAHAGGDPHAAPPGVPLVAIFSPFDGVVREDAARIPAADLRLEGGCPRENIEIVGSHCGMAVNALALIAICDRLLADPANWRPFDPADYLPRPLDRIAPVFWPGAGPRWA